MHAEKIHHRLNHRDSSFQHIFARKLLWNQQVDHCDQPCCLEKEGGLCRTTWTIVYDIKLVATFEFKTNSWLRLICSLWSRLNEQVEVLRVAISALTSLSLFQHGQQLEAWSWSSTSANWVFKFVSLLMGKKDESRLGVLVDSELLHFNELHQSASPMTYKFWSI